MLLFFKRKDGDLRPGVVWLTRDAPPSRKPSQEIGLFPGVDLLGGHEVGERGNVFKPLPCCHVDLRAGHGVTSGQSRSVGYRTQPPRVVPLGEKDHGVRGASRLARRR